MIRSVAVFCASSNHINEVYFQAARQLGEIFATNGLKVIYGDGGIGLMGALADGVLSKGGHITGVIPQFMVDEGWNNPKSTETIVVPDMHTRKATITQMADAMVALPGGIGTLEELTECLTWKQLGLHSNPVVILNTNGYYDCFLKALDKMVEEHFMRPSHREHMFTVVSTPEEILEALEKAPDWSKDKIHEARLLTKTC